MAEPFQVLTSKTVTLSQANIDTDQIIPARFLTTTTREGLGKAAFYDWRYEDDGSEKPEAILNRIDPSEHRILLAGFAHPFQRGLNFLHELVEMHPALFGDGRGLDQQIHQHGLAAPDPAPKIQPLDRRCRRGGLAARQLGQPA